MTTSSTLPPFDGETASPDGKYRYSLRRELHAPWVGEHEPMWLGLGYMVTIIGKNPSTANASDEDPTSRRFAHFAKRCKCTRYTAVNLYAFRSPDPAALAVVTDPVGPSNDAYVQDAITNADVILCAWGSPSPPKPPGWRERIRVVAEAVERRRRTSARPFVVVCLGKNGDGMPRHPLYLKNKTPIVEFDTRRFLEGT